jgi:hypothetical protein
MSMPVSPQRAVRILGAVRIALAAIWLAALSTSPDPATMPASAWRPVSLAYAFAAKPDAVYLQLVFLVAVLATILLLIGAATRVSGPICFAASALHLCLVHSFGKIGHDDAVMLLILFPLLFSAWGEALSVDGLRGGEAPPPPSPAPWPADWALWLATLAVALPYLSAGGLKLYYGKFLASGTFAAFLESRIIHAATWDPDPQAPWALGLMEWLLGRPLVMRVAAFGTVAFELGFWIGLCSRRLRLLAWATAVAFHAGIWLLSGIGFEVQLAAGVVMILATGAFLVGGVESAAPTGARSPAPIVVVTALTASLAVLVATHWLLPAEWQPSWLVDLRSTLPRFRWSADGTTTALAYMTAGVVAIVWGLRWPARSRRPAGAR